MELRTLLDSLVDVGDFGSLDIQRVEIDSRQCTPHTLFFAVPGRTHDGALYVDEAVSNGAAAVITTTPVTSSVPTWTVSAALQRTLLYTASSRVVGSPESTMTLVAVTGTNGKTTVTTMLAEVWGVLGTPAATIGTLTGARTTPAAPDLFRALAAHRDAWGPSVAGLVAMEVSSHALDQHRVDGLTFEVGVFTNLSHDHLDYHGTMENYYLAKRKLFEESRCRQAVVWTDDPYGERLAESLAIPVTRVSRSDATSVEMSLRESTFTWRDTVFHSPFLGDFNIDNALLALSTAVALGASPRDLASAWNQLERVPGRFDVVSSAGPTVVVDYAHTPEALEKVLVAARHVASRGRVVLVFGCGGNRDKDKRSVMGEIATTFADVVILTSDNPRDESPEAILDDIEAGCLPGPKLIRDIDRRSAIATAIRLAMVDDVVVLAGKGHETVQIIGDQVTPFDDRVVARELIK